MGTRGRRGPHGCVCVGVVRELPAGLSSGGGWAPVTPPGPLPTLLSTCQRGRWTCTQSVCYGSCSIYGSGHYITFDGKYYDFDGHCSYVAAQVRPGPGPVVSAQRGVLLALPRCSCSVTLPQRTGTEGLVGVVQGPRARVGSRWPSQPGSHPLWVPRTTAATMPPWAPSASSLRTFLVAPRGSPAPRPSKYS